MRSYIRTKRASQVPSQSKQLKTAKELEESTTTSDKKKTAVDVVVSTKQDSDSGPASLPPQKPPNRRKVNLKKSLQERAKSSETIHKVPRSSRSLSEHELLSKVEPL